MEARPICRWAWTSMPRMGCRCLTRLMRATRRGRKTALPAVTLPKRTPARLMDELA